MRPVDPARSRPDRPAPRALARYAAAWIVTGAITAALLIVGLRGCSPNRLPPLQRSDLADAARAGRCALQRTDDRRPGNPPSSGRAFGPAARPGVYDDPPDTPSLVQATRSGIVVIQYRGSLDDDELQTLRLIQRVVPKSTIVARNETRMPFVLAAVAWRRTIGCRTFSPAALEAVRLFRARNLGRGPDAGP